MISQENIFEKSMSFFGGAKHGKISTQKKKNFKIVRKKEQNLV